MIPKLSTFLLLLAALFFNSAAQAATAACPTESALVKFDYLGACGLTRTSTFTLNETSTVTRIRAWYNTNIGTNTLAVTIKGPNGFTWSGNTTKGGCDPFQTNWCEGIITLDQPLAAGSYTVDVGSTSMCSNPSGQTTLVVYGCKSASLAAPTNLRYSLTDDNVTLQWNAVTGAEGYRLLLGTTKSGEYPITTQLGNTTQLGPLNVKDFPRGAYYLVVNAYSKTTNSAPSNEIIIQLGDLAAPTNVNYSLSGDLFNMTWSPVTNATGYKVYFGTSAGKYAGVLDVSSPSFGPLNVASLPRGTYYLAASAINTKQESARSKEIAVTLAATGGATADVKNYMTLVSSLSGSILNGGLTEQLSPILSAVLGKPSTCPKVTMNFTPTTSVSNIEALLQSLPKPTIANIDYGTGCIAEQNQTLAGTATLTLDNLSIDSVTKLLNANLSMQATNLTKNGTLIADGSMSGKLAVNLGNSTGNGRIDLNNFLVPNGSRMSGSVEVQMTDSSNTALDMNISTSNNIKAQLPLAIVKVDTDNYKISSRAPGSVNQYAVNFDSVLYNNKLCKDHPIGGSVTFSAAGSTQKVVFNNRCDGSYSIE